jgi:hypothetical protein
MGVRTVPAPLAKEPPNRSLGILYCGSGRLLVKGDWETLIRIDYYSILNGHLKSIFEKMLM